MRVEAIDIPVRPPQIRQSANKRVSQDRIQQLLNISDYRDALAFVNRLRLEYPHAADAYFDNLIEEWKVHQQMTAATNAVTAQSVQNRNPPIDDIHGEPVGGTYGRTTRLAEIEAEALDFANEFLLDFDLPSTPIFRLGNMKGFEDLRKPLTDVIGVIVVHANFTTLNAHTVRIGLAIPVHKGRFQRPSVVYYHDKLRVFSQELIDGILESIETTRPKMTKMYTPRVEFQRIENIESPLFSAPNDPTGWSLLLTDRY